MQNAWVTDTGTGCPRPRRGGGCVHQRSCAPARPQPRATSMQLAARHQRAIHAAARALSSALGQLGHGSPAPPSERSGACPEARRRRQWHAGTAGSLRCSSSAPSGAAPTAAAAAPAAALVEWVRSKGAVDAGLQVVSTPDQGLGLVAAEDLSPGQRLILLPPEAQLTFDAATDPNLLALISQVPKELWGAQLAIRLLAERVQGPASPFAAYVEQLPLRVPAPIFFDKAGIDAIQYPPVSEQVKRRCRWLYDFSTKVLAGLPGTPADPFGGTLVDINALGWAMACVSSRAFRVRGPQHPAAMLPLVDMCNHAFDANCKVLPVAQPGRGKGAVGMFAKRKIAKGEPLLLSYGNLSNDFLFLDYAFTVPDNPHDRVTLRWDLELLEAAAELGKAQVPAGTFAGGGGGGSNHLPPWKKRWLTQAKLLGPGSNLEVGVGGPQPADARLLAALRVLLAASEQEVQGRSEARLGDLAAPLSRASEVAVLRVLAGLGTVALASFPTTLEQDAQLLQGGGEAGAAPLSASVQQAVGFRMRKKETLVAALQGVQRRLREVQEDEALPATTAPAALGKGQKPQSASTATKGFGGGGGKK